MKDVIPIRSQVDVHKVLNMINETTRTQRRVVISQPNDKYRKKQAASSKMCVTGKSSSHHLVIFLTCLKSLNTGDKNVTLFGPKLSMICGFGRS